MKDLKEIAESQGVFTEPAHGEEGHDCTKHNVEMFERTVKAALETNLENKPTPTGFEGLYPAGTFEVTAEPVRRLIGRATATLGRFIVTQDIQRALSTIALVAETAYRRGKIDGAKGE